jgi:hypothetical protein
MSAVIVRLRVRAQVDNMAVNAYLNYLVDRPNTNSLQRDDVAVKEKLAKTGLVPGEDCDTT